jgi:mono/diheme cytochrome c family protein
MYSNAQAKRGASLYAADCAMCHGAKLEGDSGPSLAGKDFLGRWDGQSAADLLDIVANQMPLSSPGSLKPDEALAVVAYLLHGNGFAAGEASLDASHAKGVKFHLATK